MAELTKEQKRIIRLIEKEAIAAGLDPDFALAIASLESTFQHIPASDKTSTAFGPFQVNKATAQANGVDYEEMKKSPELAIQTGIKNLARHAQNPLFEGDPTRIAAAHRFGENSEYAKTGDTSKIDKTLATYLADAMDHFEGSEFPLSVVREKSAPEKSEEMDMGSTPLGSREAIDQDDGEKIDMGSQPLAQYSLTDQETSDRRLGAAEGAGIGAFLGAVKVPALGLYKKAYDYFHRAPQAQDVNAIIEAATKVNDAKAAAQAGGQGVAQTVSPTNGQVGAQGTGQASVQTGARAQGTQGESNLGPNAKYTKKFGDPVGLTQAEIASSTGMGKGEGQAWDIIKKARDANQRIAGSFGEGWVLDPERQIMVNTSAGSGPRGSSAPPAVPLQMPATQAHAEALQRQAEALNDARNWESAVNNARKVHGNATLHFNPQSSSDYRINQKINEYAGKAGNVGRTVMQSSPVRWGMGGLGVGYNLENAAQQYGHNTPIGNVSGTTSLGAALASGLSVVPKYASKAGPAAVALTAGSQALGDIDRGDYESAKANAYLGGLGLASLPVAIGALLPSSLNRGEEEELARRRMMKPTISRP